MSKSNPNTFRDLRASFESRSKPTTATAHRSVAGDLANMSTTPQPTTQPRTSRVASLTKSIDSVLDTPAASPPVRPLAVLRPSWIGPPRLERPQTPGVQTMKQPVTVEYSSHGLQPPVFICTNLSDSPWEPIEMHHETNGEGDHVFSSTFHVEEGQYQYKFRLGEGDWWVCDGTKPTVDDGHGNKNNLLVVVSESPLRFEQPKSQPKSDAKEGGTMKKESPTPLKAPEVVPLPKHDLAPPSLMTTAKQNLPLSTPLMKHEFPDSHKGAAAEQTPEREQANPMEEDPDPFLTETQPLFKHEMLANDTQHDTVSRVEENQPTEHFEDVEQEASPLLPHEEMHPHSDYHAPLFRHESFGSDNDRHDTPRRTSLRSISSPVIPEEADPNDETLQQFPEDREGIMWKIRQIKKRLPENQTYDLFFDDPASQVGIPPPSAASVSTTHKPVDKMLAKIREAEEEEVEKEEATGEELDPLSAAAPKTPPEAEDADFEPKTASTGEVVQIEENIIIEIVEERKGRVESLLDKTGGKGNAIAVAVGLLVIAAGICSMQLL